MEIEQYQGFTVKSEPGRHEPGRFGAYWFHVERGEREVFHLEMKVTRILALTLQWERDPLAKNYGGYDDVTPLDTLARKYGREWVHGVIDLARFEDDKTYHEQRTSEWNPLFGESSVTDEDLRLEVLNALRRMNRAQQNAAEILCLDVSGIAAVIGVKTGRVQAVLSELILEGFVEPNAETFGHTAVDGACRITGEGLRELRRMEAAAESRQRATRSAASAQRAGELEVFIAYSHRDQRLRHELEKHLSLLKSEGAITCWHDRRITAGKEWESEIDTRLNLARMILLLVSADFLASKYCYGVEMKRAMERHQAGEARVIPIIVRACDWQPAPFAKLQALPADAKPVTSWANRDEAFADVARGIRAAIEELTSNP